MARSQTVTNRVPTDFGAIYVHGEMDEGGHVREISVSLPGKHDGSQIDTLLTAIIAGINETLGAP